MRFFGPKMVRSIYDFAIAQTLPGDVIKVLCMQYAHFERCLAKLIEHEPCTRTRVKLQTHKKMQSSGMSGMLWKFRTAMKTPFEKCYESNAQSVRVWVKCTLTRSQLSRRLNPCLSNHKSPAPSPSAKRMT